MLQQHPVMIAPGGMLVRISNWSAVGAYIPVLAHGNRTFRMLFQKLYSGFDTPGQQAVVVIQKQNVFALGVGDTAITCSRDTAILLVNVVNRVGSRNLCGLIGRAVIDQDDFNPGVGCRTLSTASPKKRAEL
jgi:hypothetical protein